MPRLTLRTLLAYIDDTLEPTETRSLGKKVAASEDAKLLVERIKKVTRRRGLATPEATDHDETADPNTVAAYLDNALDSATLKHVEETCLASDMHLAEVAACHQILTLVLTEPVRVPPRAHRRMYGLVPAPAALPGRRPNKALPIGGAAPPAETHAEADDADAALLLGMKRYSSATTWATRFALLGVAAVLLVLLAGAALLSLQQQSHKPPETAAGHSSALNAPAAPAVALPVDAEPKPKAPDDVPPPKPVEPGRAGELATEAALASATAVAEFAVKKPADPGPDLGDPVPPPLGNLPRIARVETPGVIVLKQTAAGGEWFRVKVNETDKGEVDAGDTVMALPGYKANVLVGDNDKLVQVHLWGNVPEQLRYRVFESRVRFHKPPDGFDADLTVLGGRVYIKSKKLGADRQPTGARVRVRVGGEVWDITLPDEKSDVLVELIAWFEPGTPYARAGGQKPALESRMAVVSGTADLAAPKRPATFTKIPAGKHVTHSSLKGSLVGPGAFESKDEAGRDILLADTLGKDIQLVLSSAAQKLTAPGGVLALMVGRLDAFAGADLPPPSPRPDLIARFAAYSLAALAEGPDAANQLKALVDELGKQKPWFTRQAVVTALVNWLPRDLGNTAILRAVLVEKGAADDEADVVLEMLRGYISPTQPNGERLDKLVARLDEPSPRLSSPAVETWVREAAFWNLQSAAQMKWVPAALADPVWIEADIKSKKYQDFLAYYKREADSLKKPKPPKAP